MYQFIQITKALSDPNRVKMVKLLLRRKMCVCEIKEVLGLAQSTTSKHLKILANAGLISSSKEGLWARYRISDGLENRYAATLLGSLKHWLENETEVTDMVTRLPERRQGNRAPTTVK